MCEVLFLDVAPRGAANFMAFARGDTKDKNGRTRTVRLLAALLCTCFILRVAVGWRQILPHFRSVHRPNGSRWHRHYTRWPVRRRCGRSELEARPAGLAVTRCDAAPAVARQAPPNLGTNYDVADASVLHSEFWAQHKLKSCARCAPARIISILSLTRPQFSILMAPAPHLNGAYTIFGELVLGAEHATAINKLASASGSPTKAAIIVGAGEL